jgi:hypothetical protein
MSSTPSTRSRSRASLRGLLLLAFVVAGLFAMHGIQAATSPSDVPGLPVMAAGPAHVASTGEAGRCSTPACPAHHRTPGHRHPGGQMCLALLVLAALFVLAVVVIHRTVARPGTCGLAGSAGGHPGRPPPTPSIFQLSVLRR